jgi:hypothetical protein
MGERVKAPNCEESFRRHCSSSRPIAFVYCLLLSSYLAAIIAALKHAGSPPGNEYQIVKLSSNGGIMYESTKAVCSQLSIVSRHCDDFRHSR